MNIKMEAPHEKLRQRTIEAHRSHVRAKVCFGLLTLLFLQYDREGHMDEPVKELLLEQLHSLSQLLREFAVSLSTDDIPF